MGGDDTGTGYAYWHGKVPSGEGAAPAPEPVIIATKVVEKVTRPQHTIDNNAFLDDDDVIKLYIDLKGDLEHVQITDVELKVEKARWDTDCSFNLLIQGTDSTHRLHAERLLHPVDPEQCKFRISTKNSKLVVTLRKMDTTYWEHLRAVKSLPFRRGGGGNP